MEKLISSVEFLNYFWNFVSCQFILEFKQIIK